MKLPFEISEKLNAVQVNNYVHRLGRVGYRYSTCAYTYDDASYADIEEIFRMLEELEPASPSGAREFWLCARRGTIEDFADGYGTYEDNLDDGTVEDYAGYEAYWKSEFPDELEWYRFVACNEEDIDYKAIFLGNEHVIEVDGRKERTFPNDISAFTGWLKDAVKLTIKAVRSGVYNEALERLLPYKHRVGTITRANLWKLYPEDKEAFFEDLTQSEVDEFLASDAESLEGTELLKEVTANDFYRFCAIGYAANNYEYQSLTPKEQYYRHADGRDEGLKDIDPDSPKAFKEWLNTRPLGGHPWEVCRGGNSTHISLYVHSVQEDTGYYLAVAGSATWRCVEAIKFYLALKQEGIPVILRQSELLKSRLRGEERVGIVPHGIFPRYCQSWFPGEKIEAFRNLSVENPEEEIRLAEWKPLDQIRVKEMSHE